VSASARWPFVGREAELDLIAQAMADPGVPGLVLAGVVGVGKTCLALEAIRRADPERYETRWAKATAAARSIPFGAGPAAAR